MASIAVSPSDKTLAFLLSAFKDLAITHSTPEPAPPVSQLTLDNAATVAGTNTIASHLATLIPAFKAASYTQLEQAEIDQWLTLSTDLSPKTLDALESNLKFRTTLIGEKLSIADVVVYARIRDTVAGWSDEERTGEHGRRHTVRWVDFVQNSPELNLSIPADQKVAIDPAKVLFHPKAEEAPKKDKKKPAEAAAAAAETVKEGAKDAAKKVKDSAKDAAGAAAAAVGGKQKKEKKEKPKREPPPPKAEPVISPAQLDLRVGHILFCRPHPNADSLFVSTIAMGDAPDAAVVTAAADIPPEVTAKYNPVPPVRTVCSGLNGLIPLAEMQDRKVVVVANLKPVTMRGIKSAAMVLAASPPPPAGEEASHKKELVELVAPPEGAATGEKLFFETYDGTPEAQLNPKKKVWEQIQPGFLTTDALEVAFDRSKAGWVGEAGEKGKAPGQALGKLVNAAGGVCTVQTVKGGNCS
ncbi:hypothetical protein EDC01DRAFT_359462 [Geopyxis carbonaria]|nr:hypothetical protein EDC01DRAFT_359462 [Geopyxis carbonaria]